MSARRPISNDGPSIWHVCSERGREALRRQLREILGHDTGSFGHGPLTVRLSGLLHKGEVC